ncbi:hypothetical protein L1987_86887 [Smallanthus sonchifolius]|uniref:Uncharacterized protein n=1 Tax=Smallanthus sonchifolius TaxID=185202 RepID=A0ACB8Y118_9ASTR|nr:hypothetical protein L1987_86887 [Smallanthus sonchifolius]
MWKKTKILYKNAAELLGKSKKILKILKARQLPDMDLDSRAYIDKWRVLAKSQVLNGGQGGASSTRIGPSSTSCILFFITMLANFLPSFGLMDDKELLMNTVALGIFAITIIANILIQTYTHVLLSQVTILLLVCPILWPFSIALIVSTYRKKLEHRYTESQHELASSHQEKRFSSKELKRYLKKYWMMAETNNPQFVIACTPISSAFGILCPLFVLSSGSDIVATIRGREYNWIGTSDYKWSLKIIFIVQSFGVVVGSIAPIFRRFTSIGHYSVSDKWSKSDLNVFRVEKYWIQRLQHWKHSHVCSHIPGRYCKIVLHKIKNTFLNFCIALHISVLVSCKTICLVPRTFLMLISHCSYFFTSYFRRVANGSDRNVTSEIEEYTRYVVHIEEEMKLSKRILRNTLHSITQLLNACEEKEPHNLMKLLSKSTGFNGVVEFDNDQVPPLYPEKTNNCWSLVVVTLTAIAISLPNIANDHFKMLLSSMREGLQIVRHIEECLNADGDSVKARKAARHIWTEVEVFGTWLQIDLQKKARKGNTSKEILKWLGDEAAKIVIQYKSSKKPSTDHSPNKFILASSMYKISQTVLIYYNEQENRVNDEELLEWISTIIADVLFACFTNLPRAIKMKCHHHAIEKMGDSIRNAALLLGKCKKILKNLKARRLPNIDLESMAYIDKWRILPKDGDTSLIGIQPGPSNSNKSLIVTIMH